MMLFSLNTDHVDAIWCCEFSSENRMNWSFEKYHLVFLVLAGLIYCPDLKHVMLNGANGCVCVCVLSAPVCAQKMKRYLVRWCQHRTTISIERRHFPIERHTSMYNKCTKVKGIDSMLVNTRQIGSPARQHYVFRFFTMIIRCVNESNCVYLPGQCSFVFVIAVMQLHNFTKIMLTLTNNHPIIEREIVARDTAGSSYSSPYELTTG